MGYYNWDTNTLEFCRRRVKVKLVFKKDKTIVKGMSGTGKSFIVSSIEGAISASKKLSDSRVRGIFVLNKDNSYRLIDGEVKHNLVVIDRGEMVIDKELVEFINNDEDNRYLIFIRKPIGLAITPNNIAELVSTGDSISIRYLVNQRGWN